MKLLTKPSRFWAVLIDASILLAMPRTSTLKLRFALAPTLTGDSPAAAAAATGEAEAVAGKASAVPLSAAHRAAVARLFFTTFLVNMVLLHGGCGQQSSPVPMRVVGTGEAAGAAAGESHCRRMETMIRGPAHDPLTS